MLLPQRTDLSATQNFEQLREGIRKRYERIVALEVEYETRQELVRPEPQLAELVPRSRHRFAFKGENRFKSQSGMPREHLDALLEMDSILAFDGAVTRSRHRSAKTGSVDRGKRFSGIDGYVHSLAILLKDERPPCSSGIDDYSLPIALNLAELGWNVRPTLDLVDGKACHVLETNSRQRLWIDPHTDYAMRFRERPQAINARPVDEWPLSSRVALREYSSIAGDISLPRRIERTSFLSTRMPESEWNEPSVLSVIEVAYLAVNEDVNDGLFTLSFPVGTRVNDRVQNRFYRVGRANTEINLAGPEWYLNLTRRFRKT